MKWIAGLMLVCLIALAGCGASGDWDEVNKNMHKQIEHSRKVIDDTQKVIDDTQKMLDELNK